MGREVGFNNRDRFVELGLVISAIRKSQGLTQTELAERAKISRSHLSSIEARNITQSFSLEVWVNISDALAIRAGDLLNMEFPSVELYYENENKTNTKKNKTNG